MVRYVVLLWLVRPNGVLRCGGACRIGCLNPTTNAVERPGWLTQVVQFHGHLGPSVVAGARMGMAGHRAVGAKGYFDVEVTCEGPFAQPPQACFLDGLKSPRGATLGKRTLHRVQADRIAVRFRNTRTGKTAELCPTPALVGLLPSFKPDRRPPAESGTDRKARMLAWNRWRGKSRPCRRAKSFDGAGPMNTAVASNLQRRRSTVGRSPGRRPEEHGIYVGGSACSIAIIGVLLALLLPAVQAAREAARRLSFTTICTRLA